jgi:hypothetical protein
MCWAIRPKVSVVFMSSVRGRRRSIEKKSAIRAGRAVKTAQCVPGKTASRILWVTKMMVFYSLARSAPSRDHPFARECVERTEWLVHQE